MSVDVASCHTQSSEVLDAELTRHKAANAAMERDVARFKERAGILGKVCVHTFRAATRLNRACSSGVCTFQHLPVETAAVGTRHTRNVHVCQLSTCRALN